MSNMELSVVIVSISPPAILQRCLEALAPQIDAARMELMVVAQEQPAASLNERFPNIISLVVANDSTVPSRRLEGIKISQAKIVALIEDDCIVPSDWCETLIRAHRANMHAAIGGPVVPGDYDRTLDWSIFFCEYGRFMPPFEGIVAVLPGNNMSYKRECLEGLLAGGDLKDGFYEVFVNDLLLKRGETLQSESALAVRNVHSWNWSNATEIPFHHGRGFAAMRFRDGEWTKKFAYAFITVLLPALQTLRVCSNVLPRKRYNSRLLAALPGVVLFWTSWSVGEFMGYLLGPGESLKRWR